MDDSVELPPLEVVAGLIEDDQGRLLVGQRVSGTMAGYWEFPGGKIDPGESPEQALRRELREELGIDVSRTSFVMELNHRYPEHAVCIEVWRVDAYEGEPTACEGQSLAWTRPEDLLALPLLPADAPLVEHLLG